MGEGGGDPATEEHRAGEWWSDYKLNYRRRRGGIGCMVSLSAFKCEKLTLSKPSLLLYFLDIQCKHQHMSIMIDTLT